MGESGNLLCVCYVTARNLVFLERKERQRIFGRQQYQDLYNHDVDSAFKEYTVMRSTWNDIAREENDGKIRLSNAIEHQWRIDHIPGNYRITQEDERSRMKGIKTAMKEKTKNSERVIIYKLRSHPCSILH